MNEESSSFEMFPIISYHYISRLLDFLLKLELRLRRNHSSETFFKETFESSFIYKTSSTKNAF